MRLLIISNMYPSEYDPSYGPFVKSIADAYVQRDRDVRCIYLTKSRTLIEKITGYFKFYLVSFKSCFSCDVAYIHYPSHCAFPVILAKLFGARFKSVYHFHGSDLVLEYGRSRFFHKIKSSINRRSVNHSDLIVVPSIYFKNKICDEFKIMEERVAISPSGGIESAFFNCSSLPTGSGFRLGFVGRLTLNKGAADLMKIMTQLSAQYTLLCAGSDPEGYTQNLSQGLGDRFKYLCVLPRAELVSFYSNVDILLFPTYRESESLGLVVLESIACGVPVISYDYGAAREIIIPGINGSIVEPGKVGQMGDEIVKWTNRYANHKLHRNSVSVTVEAYQSASVMSSLVTLIDSVYVGN